MYLYKRCDDNYTNFEKMGGYFSQQSISEYIRAGVAGLLFIVGFFVLRLEISSISLGEINIDGGSFKGVVSHLLILLSVYFVIETIKRGYLIAIVLNLVAIFMVVRSIIMDSNYSALPGITNFVVSLILIIILYRYRERIFEQVGLLLKQKEQLEHMAFYDSLTEIPNRKRVIDHLNNIIIKQSPGNQNKFTLVFIDMNNFKKINDTLGHYVGDIVLKMIVRRLKSYIHDDDFLGRLGGDEFALIIQRQMSKDEIILYIEGLRDLFLEVFMFEKKDIFLNACFGVSTYPQDGATAGDLLKSADIAMYKAKNNSTNSIEFFSLDIQQGFIENVKLENGLKHAIIRDELYLVFQPQFASKEKLLRGFEALLRWNSLELGQVSPEHFIPVAEKAGFISGIGEWVIRNAMQEFKKICERYNIKTMLSVNISVVQLLEPSFVDMVGGIIDETGFDSNYLEFEVTESIFISYPDYVKEVLSQLQGLGISIALDDFGTGYASLSYLQNIPIDTLKIDKVFTDSISKYNKNKNILGPIIDMAHQLEIMVIAEGVEDMHQLEYLTAQRCDYIQGYLLGKPIGEDGLYQMLEQNNINFLFSLQKK